MFGHERLIVYTKSMEFVDMRRDLLAQITRRVATCDHFARASESVVLNIAHASSAWSPAERIVYLGNANGSALECAAYLDVFVAKSVLGADDIYDEKCKLREIVRNEIGFKDESE